MPPLALRSGLGGAHLLRSGLTPKMTAEQRLRGADAGMDWALLVTGYQQDVAAALAHSDLC